MEFLGTEEIASIILGRTIYIRMQQFVAHLYCKAKVNDWSFNTVRQYTMAVAAQITEMSDGI